MSQTPREYIPSIKRYSQLEVAGQPGIITTVRGKGYRLDAPVKTELRGALPRSSSSPAEEVLQTVPPTSPVESMDADLWHPLPAKVDMFILLTWRMRLTKLYGRDQEREELRQWACAPGYVPRVRILTGPGGAGKTRLAAEICSDLRREGWGAEFVKPNRPPDLSQPGSGLLLIIDYPEERQDEVKNLLIDLMSMPSPTRPFRVLLLSRQTEEWWSNTSSLRNLRANYLFDTVEIRLGSLSAEDTIKMFREACRRVSDHYSWSVPQIHDNEIIAWRSRNEELHALGLDGGNVVVTTQPPK